VQNNSQKYGQEGEELAVAHLLSKGYKILERNWRFGKLEIDLIAKYGELVVFVEVKARKNLTFGEPEIFVSRRKQSYIITAANHYLITNDLDLESRFDIIAISRIDNENKINHLEGAFSAVAR
jgi:putative endonuclease